MRTTLILDEDVAAALAQRCAADSASMAEHRGNSWSSRTRTDSSPEWICSA